jgi:hypothetical protein
MRQVTLGGFCSEGQQPVAAGDPLRGPPLNRSALRQENSSGWFV